MTQNEFNKLNKGSIVCFGQVKWFQGVMLAKGTFDANGKVEKNQVYVDFPPNSATSGYDPAPFWYDASGLEVIEYAEGGNTVTESSIDLTKAKELIGVWHESLNALLAQKIVIIHKIECIDNEIKKAQKALYAMERLLGFRS